MSSKQATKKQDEGKVEHEAPLRQKESITEQKKVQEDSKETISESKDKKIQNGKNQPQAAQNLSKKDAPMQSKQTTTTTTTTTGPMHQMSKNETNDSHIQMQQHQRKKQNTFNIDDFNHADDVTMPVLRLTESDPKRHEEVKRTMHFTPTTLQQNGHDLRQGDLPSGKTTHTTRVVTVADHERVIVTKTVTKINGEEVAVHTRQITHDLEHKPLNLAVSPNVMNFEGNLTDRLRVKASPMKPLDYLLRDEPEIYLANPQIRVPDMQLNLDHLEPNLNLHLKPLETKMKINYALEEEATVKAVKIVKPVDIDQRILKKTTKEVRSIPTIVHRDEVCDGVSSGHGHSHGTSSSGTFKMTKTETVDGKTTKTSQTKHFSGDDGADGDFIRSAQEASSFSEQAAKEAKDIKTKGLSIVETLKRQADELREAAIATNKGIEELDEARQAEVHARLNSHRLQIEKELEARIAEEQELALRVTTNAEKLKASVADQIKSEFARIQGQIKAQTDAEEAELKALKDRFFGLAKENLARIEPWVKQRMDELAKSLAAGQKALETSRLECEKAISERSAAIEAEAKDRMELISKRLQDEVAQLRQCRDMIEKEETEIFHKRRTADEDRMKKELDNQAATEKRYIVDCCTQIEHEVAAKIKEVQEIAKLRKTELDKQVEREKLMIDQFCEENIRGLESDRENATNAAKKRQEFLKTKYETVASAIPHAWDSTFQELKSRIENLREETARREKELQSTLETQRKDIQALRDQRAEELKALSQNLSQTANERKTALNDAAKKLQDQLTKTAANAAEECKRQLHEVEQVYGGQGNTLQTRYKNFMDALAAEKLVHEEELLRLINEAEQRAKDLSMNIRICKERLLDNSKDYEAELKQCQEIVAQREIALQRLRDIEEERKKAVLATEAAFSSMRMELELTRQALGSLRLSSEDIEANTHQYAIESKGSRTDKVSESSASATASKSINVETSTDAGGQVRKNVSESETKIVRR